MPEIRIKVGAALDANVAGLFRPWVEAAKKARQQIDAELGKLGRGAGRGLGTGAGGGGASSPAVASLGQEAALIMRNLRIRKRAEEEERREIARTAAERKRALQEEARERAKNERDAVRSAMEELRSRRNSVRERMRHEREQARLAERSAEDDRSFGRRTSYRTVHHFGNTLRTGSRVANDIARGAGVNLNLGSLVGGAVELQKRAVDLSNAAFMPGAAGPAGQRQSAATLMQEAKDVGNFAAFDPTKIIEGLQAFVAKTGDLQTGRDVLRDMAQLSRATGASMEHMIDAAGDVANALGETDNKGAKVANIMKVVAGQGKIGAVEIKNLTTQMAKLGASATAFEGDPMENLTMMGAMVQMSRAKGGSASATQAATSVASFVNTLRTPARMAEFEAATGKKFYNEKTGMMRSPEEIIVESLRSTGGDPARFKKIFANVQGARAVEGFATVYRQAGGGDAGIAAVRAEFDRFRKIAMSQGEISESFNKSMETAEAKVQLFNNRLAEVGARIAERVLPQLERLAPKVLDAVEALGKLTGWAAENPIKAIFAALGVSIMRAAGEATIRSGIESAIRASFRGGAGVGAGTVGAGGAVGGGQFVAAPAGKLGAALGAAGAAMAIAATAVTIEQVGELIIDNVMNRRDKAEDATRNATMASESARLVLSTSTKSAALGQARDVAGDIAAGHSGFDVLGPSFDAAAAQKLQAQQEILQARIAAAEEGGQTGIFTSSITQSPLWRAGSSLINYATGGEYGTKASDYAQMDSDKASIEDLKAEMARNTEILQRLLGGTLNVNVMNSAPVGPPAPTGMRMGPDYENYPVP